MTKVLKENPSRMEVVSPLSSCNAFVCGHPSSLEMINENFSDENMLQNKDVSYALKIDNLRTRSCSSRLFSQTLLQKDYNDHPV